MDLINYLDKFRIDRAKNRANAEQVLADEIWHYFKKQPSFPRIMYEIKVKGPIFVREIFNEIKKSNPRNRLALFWYRIKNCEIQWQE